MKTKSILLAAAVAVGSFVLPTMSADAGNRDGRWYNNGGRKVVVYRDNGYQYYNNRPVRYYNNGYYNNGAYYSQPYYYNRPYYRSGPGVSLSINLGN